MDTACNSDFINLNCHSEYSFYRSAAKIPSLVFEAKKLGMSALALTDSGNMYGILEFSRICKAKGIKPICGTEAVLTGSCVPCRLILLARNSVGYANLVRLYDGKHPVDSWGVTKIEWEKLRSHGEGIICIVDSRSYLDQQHRIFLKELSLVFDTGHLFLGVAPHLCGKDSARLDDIATLSKETRLPVVGLSPDLDEGLSHISRDVNVIRSTEEASELFKDIPEAVSNTRAIRDMIDFELPLDGPRAPVFPIPAEFKNSAEYLRYLVERSLGKRYGIVTSEIRERVDYELAAFHSRNYEDYLLLVWDLISFAQRKEIVTVAGYGQFHASIVCFALGISDIDPLRFGLLFDKFLEPPIGDASELDEFKQLDRAFINIYFPERSTHPRIGLLIAPERRHELLDYLKLKFGDEMILGTASFVTNKQKIQKSDHRRRGKICPLRNSSPSVAIINRTTMKDIPLARTSIKASPLAQFKNDDIETSGAVCIDIYTRDEVSIIERVAREIKLRKNDFSVSRIPLNDSATLELFRKGNTDWISAFKSDRMKSALRNFRPDNFKDLTLLYVINRQEFELIFQAIVTARKNGTIDSTIVKTLVGHPYCKEATSLLAETYGVLVYQEQIMGLLNVVCGLDYIKANRIRRAFIQRRPLEQAFALASQARKDLSSNPVLDIESKIFMYLLDNSSHCFNKNSAVADVKRSWTLAYLKANYPEEFEVGLVGTMKKIPA